MKIKQTLLSLLSIVLIGNVEIAAANYKITEGNWTLNYLEAENSIDIEYGGRAILNDAYSLVVYNFEGSEQSISIASNGSVTPDIYKENVANELGDGTCYVFAYTSGGVVMKQKFTFYPDSSFLLAQVTLESLDGSILRSNNMVALASDSDNTMVEGSTNRRMLWVPFDNDEFVKYNNFSLSNVESTSHEVTSLFDGDSRNGIVAGSIDHDTWKSGVSVKASQYVVGKFSCFSGYTDYWTHDIMPHGKVKGSEIASARFMFGVFDDWRDGMDTFASVNATFAAPIEWTKGNPMGWNSWGVMEQYVNYDGVVETAEFIKNELFGLGFHNNEGQTVISLDSFALDNISYSKLYTLGTKVFSDGEYKVLGGTKQGTNQILGLYDCPFTAWEWILDSQMDGTGVGGAPTYKWRDACLKFNGVIRENGGMNGYFIDPTHPGIRARLEFMFKRWDTMNCRYVKMDFLNYGIMEGDSWYDPDVTTGTQAYNYGMKIVRELAEQYGIYVLESISPIFPYQYAHARRVSCDSWSYIGNSEYVMNAISYGWWTDKLYPVNDGDHLVMCRYNSADETDGENRARATTGMATGAFIFGDNFSEAVVNGNGSVLGNPNVSKAIALKMMGNVDINDYVRNNTGSFRPVEGFRPSSGNLAESLFVRETEQYVYFIVFNYTTYQKSSTIDFAKIGIANDNVGEIKELWLNEDVTFDNEKLSYKVPAKDARIYRIAKKDYSGIENIDKETDATDVKAVVVMTGDECVVSATDEISVIGVYDASGRRIMYRDNIGMSVVSLPINVVEGVYIVKCELVDGSVVVQKCFSR